MNDDTNAESPKATLRFLAEAAITVLTASTMTRAENLIPEDAAEPMLRTLLEHAVLRLRATSHQQLADEIEAFLAEPSRAKRPSFTLSSDIALLAVTVFAVAGSFLLDLPDLIDASDILVRFNRAPAAA